MLSDATTRTALQLGNTVEIVSVKDQGDNRNYTVKLNFQYKHRLMKGKCQCGMWGEDMFPCKHAMFIFRHRNRNDKQKTMKYILDRNYCCAQFSNENYIKMFHTMFGNNIEEYPIPDIEQIANFNGQSIIKIPDCISNTFDSDGSQPKCTCGFHDGKQKNKRPGRKPGRRWYQRAKGKKYC
jgi:hypothetical protein